MTTKKAFEQLTAKRGWYAQCGIDPQTARSLKRNFHSGKISLDKIHSLLESAGYTAKIAWNFEPKK